ncbi:unnamed protein product, partial [Pylaiella littoralis]
KAAAQQHPGLCGVHHTEYIGGVSYTAAVGRTAEDPVSTKNLRNQAGTGLNATGRGVQLKRKECFTKACRAVWPGDTLLTDAVIAALLLP